LIKKISFFGEEKERTRKKRGLNRENKQRSFLNGKKRAKGYETLVLSGK
jgi:hypothetical protein